MLRKSKLPTLLAVFAVAACSDRSPTGPDRAALNLELVSSESGGCVAPFTPVAAAGAVEDVDGDGIVCQFETIPPGSTEPQIAVMDNHTPPQTIGACPRYFIEIDAILWWAEYDRNGDKKVCTMFNFNYGFNHFQVVYVDNNVGPRS